MKKTIFTGSGVAIVTPFNGFETNYEVLGELIEMQIAGGTDSIIICGTTGEAATMPDAEHLAAIEYTVKKVAGRIPVIAGTGSNDTKHAIYLSQEAEKLGADGLLVVTPYYNKSTQKGLIRHFTEIANSVKLPIILYNVPSRTGMNIAIDTVAELAKLDNIVGVKDATGDISYTAALAAKVPEIAIYSGNDDMTVPIMSLGGKGVISVIANILPKDTHDMCAYYLAGETDKALKLQLSMLDVMNSMFIEVNPVPVKTALGLMGYNVGNLRAPLYEMDEANLEKMKKAMTDYGIKLA